jgi:hypothetical protein
MFAVIVPVNSITLLAREDPVAPSAGIRLVAPVPATA